MFATKLQLIIKMLQKMEIVYYQSQCFHTHTQREQLMMMIKKKKNVAPKGFM